MEGELTFRPATKADASALAVLVAIGGEGLPADLWSTLKVPGQSILEVGRERAVREQGGFSYRNAIVVGSVAVGQDSAMPWRSNVSPAEIQETLVRTLAMAGLGTPQGGRWRLDVVLVSLQRPYAGFAMTVPAQIAYRLTEVATGTVVYDSVLTTLGSASLDDAVTNENRLRIAEERAVRANLRRLVEELYALPEPPPARQVRR